MSDDVRIAGITYYPVKSCAGVDLTTAAVTATGLAGDRSFLIVTTDGTYLTQREVPALATLRPSLADGHLTMTGPTGAAVTVPADGDGPRTTITVWEHTGPAIDTGDAAADFVSTHLGVPARLVRLAPEHRRPVDPDYATTAEVGFSDGYPLLLLGQESLLALNERLPRPLPANRFRANITISGSAPFAEDSWDRVTIGSATVQIVKPCARCAITTVDQDTGHRDGAEPLRTLGTFRRGERGVLFGQNAIVLTPGPIAVGDPVTALLSSAAPPGHP